jgi:hypothetical protein
MASTAHSVKKAGNGYRFFEKHVSTDDQEIIRTGIKISDNRIPNDYKITMERFSMLLVSVRNLVAHEGIYWNLQFIQEEAEERIPTVNRFSAKPDKNSPPSKVVFTTTMKFSEIRDIFVKSYIHFISQ